jgi:hypothetical protein
MLSRGLVAAEHDFKTPQVIPQRRALPVLFCDSKHLASATGLLLCSLRKRRGISPKKRLTLRTRLFILAAFKKPVQYHCWSSPIKRSLSGVRYLP